MKTIEHTIYTNISKDLIDKSRDCL